jgi:hypothetical protein
MHSSTWDGAATMMGNSTKQWKASYNPSNKRRAVQCAIDAHTTFASNVVNGEGRTLTNFQLPPTSSELVAGSSSHQVVVGSDVRPVSRPLPFQLHPMPIEGKTPPAFIPSSGPSSGKKRKGKSSSLEISWGTEWGSW